MAARKARRYQIDGAPDRFEALCEALSQGNRRAAACRLAGIHRSTLYEWLNNSTLSDTIKKAEADAEAEMVKRIRAASNRTWTAAAWWLERKMPDEWGKKEQHTFKVDWREKVKQAGHDPDELFRHLVETARSRQVATTGGSGASNSHAGSDQRADMGTDTGQPTEGGV